MKLITAIIQPHRLDEVKKELYAADVNLITVCEALGHGRQFGVDVQFPSHGRCDDLAGQATAVPVQQSVLRDDLLLHEATLQGLQVNRPDVT